MTLPFLVGLGYTAGDGADAPSQIRRGKRARGRAYNQGRATLLWWLMVFVAGWA